MGRVGCVRPCPWSGRQNRMQISDAVSFSLVSPSSSPVHQLTLKPSYASLSDVTRNLPVRRSTRPLLSQANRSASTLSSSGESVIAPSTIHEGRISVSSTVYPDSLYEEEMAVSPAPTVTDEFGAMQSRTHSNAPSISEARSSFAETDPQTKRQSHPFAQEPESPTTTLHHPIGVYPDNRSFSMSKSREPVTRPRSTDQAKQFLVPKPGLYVCFQQHTLH